MGFLPVDDQLEIISRGTEEVIPLQDLRHKLEYSIKNNKPLVVKLGCDPSRPDLHIGHSVVLQKLRDFQDLGHQAILVIGDFTAMIGDPSERNKTRPQLTIEEAKANYDPFAKRKKDTLLQQSMKMLALDEAKEAKMNVNNLNDEIVEQVEKLTARGEETKEQYSMKPTIIIDKKEDLLGIILTHAHEDHIGAIAHIWPKLKCKIYATPFTSVLITEKFKEKKIDITGHLKIIELTLP